MTIYRIAQEALNNVEKHSRATHAEIRLSCTRNYAQLVVRDNGRGFELSDSKKLGWGLQNITERATLLAGNVNIVSASRKGAKISVRIPLEARSRPGVRKPK